MVFQHGNSLADCWNAHELSSRAAEMGYGPARWLAAAAHDRWCVLLSIRALVILERSRGERYGAAHG